MNLRHFARFFTCLCATALIAPAAISASVTHAWARPGNDQVAVYFTLTNTTDKAITLVGAQTPIASSVELHESQEASSGMGIGSEGMTMQTLQSLTIEPHQHITFAPGGYHLMLIHMHHALALGRHFPLTLLFRNKTRATIPVTVANF